LDGYQKIQLIDLNTGRLNLTKIILSISTINS
jgi:hypothetical protein